MSVLIHLRLLLFVWFSAHGFFERFFLFVLSFLVCRCPQLQKVVDSAREERNTKTDVFVTLEEDVRE